MTLKKIQLSHIFNKNPEKTPTWKYSTKTPMDKTPFSEISLKHPKKTTKNKTLTITFGVNPQIDLMGSVLALLCWG